MKKLHFYLYASSFFLFITGYGKNLCPELLKLPQVKNEYATHYKIFRDKSQSLLLISDQYFLLGKAPSKKCLQENLHYFAASPKRFAGDSTSIYPWFEILEIEPLLNAFSQKKFLHLDKAKKNKLFELGYPIKQEILLSQKIDIFFSSTLTDKSILIVPLLDYLESHPLGRLEWIKVLAFFSAQDEKAQNYFSSIVVEYNKLANLVKTKAAKPVLIGEFIDQVFYAPAANSYLAKLIEDAGGNYFFKHRSESKTIQLKKEEMILELKDKIWNFYLPQNHKSLLELKSSFTPISLEGIKIINNNKKLKGDSNDYWQNGVNSPQLLLKDLIKIFHPEALPLHQLIWYQQL